MALNAERILKLAALSLTASSIILTSCSPASPNTTPTPSAMLTVNTDTRDDFHITPPDGWTEFSGTYGESGYYYIASANGDTGYSSTAMRVRRESLYILKFIFKKNPEDPQFVIDMNEYRDRSIRMSKTTKEVSEVIPLPDRTVGGERAVGYSDIYTKNGIPQKYETWMVGRHDGIWTLSINSAPGETVIPPEASAALDTVYWTPPEAPAPSPSPTES